VNRRGIIASSLCISIDENKPMSTQKPSSEGEERPRSETAGSACHYNTFKNDIMRNIIINANCEGHLPAMLRSGTYVSAQVVWTAHASSEL
jgi:hypothetical protein